MLFLAGSYKFVSVERTVTMLDSACLTDYRYTLRGFLGLRWPHSCGRWHAPNVFPGSTSPWVTSWSGSIVPVGTANFCKLEERSSVENPYLFLEIPINARSRFLSTSQSCDEKRSSKGWVSSFLLTQNVCHFSVSSWPPCLSVPGHYSFSALATCEL